MCVLINIKNNPECWVAVASQLSFITLSRDAVKGKKKLGFGPKSSERQGQMGMTILETLEFSCGR